MDITILIIWFACGLICYSLAKEKGKNELIAFALGLLFGFFAVVYYLLSKGSPEYQVRKAKETIKKHKAMED